MLLVSTREREEMRTDPLLTVFFWVVVSGCVLAQPLDREAALSSIRNHCSFGKHSSMKLSPVSEDFRKFAGHFTASTELAGGGIVLFDGNDLYLFPDASYLYVEWACEMPETIADRGTWSYVDGSIILLTDGTVRGGTNLMDRQYLPILLKSSSEPELRLISVPYDPDDCGFPSVDKLEGKAARNLKQTLMKTAWRPEFWQW